MWAVWGLTRVCKQLVHSLSGLFLCLALKQMESILGLKSWLNTEIGRQNRWGKSEFETA